MYGVRWMFDGLSTARYRRSHVSCEGRYWQRAQYCLICDSKSSSVGPGGFRQTGVMTNRQRVIACKKLKQVSGILGEPVGGSAKRRALTWTRHRRRQASSVSRI